MEPTTAIARAPQRELSSDVVRAALGYVDRLLGRGALAEVVDAAGVGDIDGVLGDPQRWYSHVEVLAVARAAADACHETDFGRRTGEELIASMLRSGAATAVRRAGTLGAVLPWMVNAGNKMAASRHLRVVEAHDDHAVIEGRWTDPSDADPFFCGVAAGSYAAAAALFGAVGSVVETSCQSRGDAVCTFRLSWVSEPAVRDDADVRAIVGADAVGNSETLLNRFEQLQEVGSKLATAEDVATALQLIIDLVSVAVSAPKYLLAVRPAPAADLQVHHRGWDEPGQAEAVARRLDAGTVHDNELVVPLASDQGGYGVIAVVFSEAYAASPVERRLLAAYAGHAVSALEAAAALESARRDRDTATALLVLARALGELSTQPQVIAALSDIVPTVIGCDHVWVWLWEGDGDDGSLRLAATSVAPDAGLPMELTQQDVPGVTALVDQPRPMFLRRSTENGPILEHMVATGTEWCAVVPIIARGDFLGVVVSGFGPGVEEADHQAIVDRMQGLAGQAAAALDNARLLDRIRDQALRDPLTGLPNRPLMADRAEQALRVAARTSGQVGLLFVDLDRFKIVNDTLGHAAGDQLICLVAERISGCLRASDTLARLGGDEFVVLLAEIDGVADATAAAARIVDALREPLEFDGRQLFVSCSVGVAVSPGDGLTYSDLLQHADAAMYEAKDQGRNTYETRAVRPADGRNQLDLETDLHRAAERDQLVVLYQPQIDFRTMKIVSVEALLRWDHHELGRLSPDAFLPMAEESGLIVELDRWVREQAASQAVRWRDAGTPLRVAINISTRDLRRPTLCAEIADLLERWDLEPHLLELEITDRVIMSEEALPAILAEFRGLGVRLAIDDFGTGTSVLGRLQRCPVDVLKIDKGFVQTITAASPDAPVVAALMTLAHRLGMEVVAEGVETAFQGGLLRRLGCHLAQGYFFSPPIDVEALDALLRSPVTARAV